MKRLWVFALMLMTEEGLRIRADFRLCLGTSNHPMVWSILQSELRAHILPSLDGNNKGCETNRERDKHSHGIVWCSGYNTIPHNFIQQKRLNSRFCAGSNPACGMSDIGNGEDL